MRAFLLAVAIAALMNALVGCANNQTTTNSTPADSSAKTYTSDLERTGKRDAADALRSADPAVTTTTNGR